MEPPILKSIGFTDIANKLASGSFSLGTFTLNPYILMKSIFIVVALFWVSGFAVKLVDRRLKRTGMRVSNRVLITKLLQIFLYCFAFIIGMQLLGINLTALSVFGGALGVGLGFGLQKIASNFISGIILLFEKSIEVGDLIELADGTTGFVRRTYARYTVLEAQDGRDVLIPNEEFISHHVINWTHHDKNARAEITVTVAYDSDIALAKKIMLDAANNHPKRAKKRPSVCVVHTFKDFGIELLLYFWVADVIDGRIEPKGEVMENILLTFKANNITIPYPQREVRMTHMNQALGEAGA